MHQGEIRRFESCDEVTPMPGWLPPPPDAEILLADIARRDEWERRGKPGERAIVPARASYIGTCAFRFEGEPWRMGYGGLVSIEGGPYERLVLVAIDGSGRAGVCDRSGPWMEWFGAAAPPAGTSRLTE
jgi:hypothetical protein